MTFITFSRVKLTKLLIRVNEYINSPGNIRKKYHLEKENVMVASVQFKMERPWNEVSKISPTMVERQ